MSDSHPSGAQPKKKVNWLQWVMLLVFTAIGLLCGMLMVQVMESLSLNRVEPVMLAVVFLLIMLVMYLLMGLHAVAHEAGHLIFGLATGYRFVSFRAGSLILVKDGQGYRLRKLRLSGTGGQCLMAPPEPAVGQMPYVLYNLGGCLMNLLCAVVSAAAAFLCMEGSIARAIFFMSAIIALAYALLNGLPIPGEIANDGQNVLSISKNPAALDAFRTQLLINRDMTCGKRLRDMPEEWFRWPSPQDRTDDLTMAVATLCTSRLLDEHRLEECTARLEELLCDDRHQPEGVYQKLLVNDYIFCLLLNGETAKATERMIREQQSFMKAMKGNPPVHRTGYAYALLALKDEVKARKCLTDFNKVARRYPHEAEIQSERELLAMADEKAELANE